MRDIKFRVWDVESLKWVTDQAIFNYCCETEPVNTIFGNLDKTGYCAIRYKYNRFIFQEYTGLKDKNGREIYEGDTLKIDDWEYNPKVVWFNGGFVARYEWTEKDVTKHADCGFAYFAGKNIIEII